MEGSLAMGSPSQWNDRIANPFLAQEIQMVRVFKLASTLRRRSRNAGWTPLAGLLAFAIPAVAQHATMMADEDQRPPSKAANTRKKTADENATDDTSRAMGPPAPKDEPA